MNYLSPCLLSLLGLIFLFQLGCDSHSLDATMESAVAELLNAQPDARFTVYVDPNGPVAHVGHRNEFNLSKDSGLLTLVVKMLRERRKTNYSLAEHKSAPEFGIQIEIGETTMRFSFFEEGIVLVDNDSAFSISPKLVNDLKQAVHQLLN